MSESRKHRASQTAHDRTKHESDRKPYVRNAERNGDGINAACNNDATQCSTDCATDCSSSSRVSCVEAICWSSSKECHRYEFIPAFLVWEPVQVIRRI
jgi:hypothetical protein